ncbi:NAD(P)/FAD-dependent oxidoreductase [Pseudonocardia ailaonensis]|uniref:NAD(P)/FAD-dependent oxidoreductase n=1 Tax=Pseudonocardia ailaonensis TaxID=367279 RepID=A0ABN2NR77_9PSEU
MNMDDVVVVGGGVAGLSAALVLSRARWSVVVVDAGEPRNAPADGVHNYLGREGTPPRELTAVGRAEASAYGARIVAGEAVTAVRIPGGFAVTLASGEVLRGRRLLVTTGLTDELPAIDGLAARWGRDVLHCPFCHGHEVRDRPIGVLGLGGAGLFQAQLFRQWSRDVTLFLHTGDQPTAQQWAELAARGIQVVDGEVTGVEVTDDRLSGIRLDSGAVVPREALVVASTARARSAVLESLGITPVEIEAHGIVAGSQIPTTPRTGATSVPGVYVAGSLAEVSAIVIASAAHAAGVAGAITMDLVTEDVARAVAGPFSAESEREIAVAAHGL